jgi:hypothetical protein
MAAQWLTSEHVRRHVLRLDGSDSNSRVSPPIDALRACGRHVLCIRLNRAPLSAPPALDGRPSALVLACTISGWPLLLLLPTVTV